MGIFETTLLDELCGDVNHKKLLTLKEASELYSISLSRLQKWSARKSIPRLKIGRSVYIEPHTFEDWLERYFIPYHETESFR
jgi:excisionase family DNA binding protein